MASGPSEPRSPRRPPDDDPRTPDAGTPGEPGRREGHSAGEARPSGGSGAPEEPRIRHAPPGPRDDHARGLPVASPWGMPPFASPTPEDEPGEGEAAAWPKGRRPYSSPTASPEAAREAGQEPEQRRRPRRTVDRPDKLVATGPPRPQPPRAEPAVDRSPPPRAEPVGEGPHPPGAEPVGERSPSPGAEPVGDRLPPPRVEPVGERGADVEGAPRSGEPVAEGQEPVAERDRPTAPHPRPPGIRTGVPQSRAQPYRRPEPAPEPPVERPESVGDVPEGEVRERVGGPPIPVRPEIEAEPERIPDERHDPHEQEGEEPVRRVGRPPGGRPTRPDLLVASGPPGPAGSAGRHHRGPAPSAIRRSSPVRRRSRLGPVVIVLTLALTVTAGVVAYQWWNSASTGLRLAAGDGRSGDELFVVPAAGDGSNQKLNDLAAVGASVVAVGSDTTSPLPRPLFLFSPDSGATWQLANVTGSTTTTVQRVVGANGRWLAFGQDGVGDERGLWTSTDGFTWAAVEPSGLQVFRKGDLIHDIARTTSGFVAVGRTVLQDGTPGPVAWHSPDGRAWTRVDSKDIGTPDKVREFRTVVAREDQVVVLAQPAQGGGSVVMRSTDGGRTWVRTATQLPDIAPRQGTLAVLPTRFVLIPTKQRDPAGDVHVYCSPTGAEWAKCGTIGGLGAQSTGVNAVVTHTAGLAAVSQSGLDRYTVYTSTDARTWSKRADLGSMPGATVRGLTMSDSGTLVAGGDQAAADVDNQLVLMTAKDGQPPAQVRLADIKGLTRVARETARVAAAEGRFVAAGSASGDAGLWTSTDAVTWKSITLAAPRQQELADLAHGRKGWLAVGTTMPDASSTEPLLVGSSDGRDWKRIEGPARAESQPYLAMQAVAAGEKGYLIAGEDRAASGTVTAALWYTTDLRKFTRVEKLPRGGAGVRIHDVAAGGRAYVAVGGSGNAERESGVVWTSADGLTWKAGERLMPPSATSAGLRQVAWYGERIVAIGTAQVPGARRAFAAVSDDDGASWQYSWLPAEQAAAVHDLASAAQGLVAVGWHGSPGTGDSAAWTSEDGLSWNRQDLTKDRLGGEGLQWLGAVTVTGADVVALGRSTTYNSDHLILWTSTLSSDR
ncbi:hypothetical protein [Nonomuraea dietziae]|uniref:Exo-alpha-sialidase n=1 Tax=Nonomuraea dietziae TaxID=65515 RepID=A0A7W5YTH0_9ACTN|nr:hypothetical protein [Nonomuraea dietziae]MBB3730659.1 hypothetical protein [Nonomuraea dietziae]